MLYSIVFGAFSTLINFAVERAGLGYFLSWFLRVVVYDTCIRGSAQFLGIPIVLSLILGIIVVLVAAVIFYAFLDKLDKSLEKRVSA